LADRNGLALKLGDGFQFRLGDQCIGRGIADDADDGERRPFVDCVDGVVVADAQRDVERAAGELLGDRGSALAAERAADDLIRGAGRPAE
jgi:hypothetical protein